MYDSIWLLRNVLDKQANFCQSVQNVKDDQIWHILVLIVNSLEATSSFTLSLHVLHFYNQNMQVMYIIFRILSPLKKKQPRLLYGVRTLGGSIAMARRVESV